MVLASEMPIFSNTNKLGSSQVDLRQFVNETKFILAKKLERNGFRRELTPLKWAVQAKLLRLK